MQMDLINVVGIGGLSLNLEGLETAGKDVVSDIKADLADKDTVTSAATTLINPFGAEGGPGGVGASILIQNVQNSTNASIQSGALVNAGGAERWSRNFDPTASGVVSDNGINFDEPTDLSTGDAIVYDVGPGGKAIGDLQDGATYYVIVDPTDPNRIQLAASLEDAEEGNAIALDPSTAAGTDQQFVAPGVSVNANTGLFDFGLGYAGAGASTFGLSGTFSGAMVADTTHAHIDPGATIVTTGAVDVSAIDELTQVAISGDVTDSRNVGASVGLNLISRDTQAYIGAGIDPATGQPMAPSSMPTTIDAGGPITVNALNDGASGPSRWPEPSPRPPSPTPRPSKGRATTFSPRISRPRSPSAWDSSRTPRSTFRSRTNWGC